MPEQTTADDTADSWLIDAARQLDPPDSEIERLISSITAKAGRIFTPARTVPTDSNRIAMSERVIKRLVATRTRSAIGRLVVFAQLAVDDDGAVDGIRVGLVARYRDDLVVLSDEVRAVVADVLSECLGPQTAARAGANIGVRWQDVYSRDWLN